MHIKPMKGSEGMFGEPRQSLKTCPKCRQKEVTVRTWESHCGGYVDYKFTCLKCGYIWWIDGPDA